MEIRALQYFLAVVREENITRAAEVLHITQPTLSRQMAQLEEEDVAFIKRFVLASGSLKQIAGEYGVTYPTVRLRLDRLIQKIELGEREDEDPYVALIKRLAVNDKLDFDTAKILIHEYKNAAQTAQRTDREG